MHDFRTCTENAAARWRLMTSDLRGAEVLKILMQKTFGALGSSENTDANDIFVISNVKKHRFDLQIDLNENSVNLR